MDEFLIPLENSQKQENNESFNALKQENELLKNELIKNELEKQKSPFNNAYEQYLMKKYYGDEGLNLKHKQDINFKSKSINEPIKQLTRISKALKASDEALKNIDEAGALYGANKKLNELSGGFIGMSKNNAELDNALINFANMSGQVTSRGGNSSNKSAEEQRRLLGGNFASNEERLNRISQTRKNILDYFEQEKSGLEALGYKLDENSALMREYLAQKKKQDYINKNANSFDFSAYEKSAYDEFAKSKKGENDELMRIKR